MNTWRVYYLYSQSLRKHYIGKTNNLQRRLYEHNNDQEVYTKTGSPWALYGYIDCIDNREATSIERKLKKAKNIKYVTWFIKSHGIYVG